MNAKKAKSIRKDLRQSGIDVRECKYVTNSPDDKFGRDRIPSLSVAQCMLSGCGRDTYLEAKRFS